ncbi:MFS transporter, partial [Pandoraea pneumonica]
SVQSSWSVGWAAAALLYWFFFAVLDVGYAWRACFWIGILPAVWITYVRRNVSDPEIFTQTRRKIAEGQLQGNFTQIFAPAHLKTTILGSLLCTGMLGGYYAITTWLPTYL